MLVAITHSNGISLMRIYLANDKALNVNPDDYATTDEYVAAYSVAFVNNEVERWKATADEVYISHREVLDADVPASRYFRAAWEDGGSGSISINTNKAKEHKMNLIRAERDARLVDSDVDILKLDGGSVPAALATKRQNLRDLPVDIQLDVDALVATQGISALEAYQPTWPV